MSLSDTIKKLIGKKDDPTALAEKRRKNNNEYIKKLGIACYENLPLRESSCEVKLKDIDSICKRAITCMISITFVFDIEKIGYDEARKNAISDLEKYNITNSLLEIEKKLFENNYDEKTKINIMWSYECYWSLVWALGLIDDIKDASGICDYKKAGSIVYDCKNYDEFKSKCKLRDIEEILDMLDLYYRYHWACVEKRIKPDTIIGSLDGEVVWERRRGLEWLVSDMEDWSKISLDT